MESRKNSDRHSDIIISDPACSVSLEIFIFYTSSHIKMTDTINTHRESSQDVQVKDHASSIQKNGSATIDEQNEQNKEAFNASKTKHLHRES
jgi:hypothetical protein